MRFLIPNLIAFHLPRTDRRSCRATIFPASRIGNSPQVPATREIDLNPLFWRFLSNAATDVDPEKNEKSIGDLQGTDATAQESMATQEAIAHFGEIEQLLFRPCAAIIGSVLNGAYGQLFDKFWEAVVWESLRDKDQILFVVNSPVEIMSALLLAYQIKKRVPSKPIIYWEQNLFDDNLIAPSAFTNESFIMKLFDLIATQPSILRPVDRGVELITKGPSRVIDSSATSVTTSAHTPRDDMRDLIVEPSINERRESLSEIAWDVAASNSSATECRLIVNQRSLVSRQSATTVPFGSKRLHYIATSWSALPFTLAASLELQELTITLHHELLDECLGYIKKRRADVTLAYPKAVVILVNPSCPLRRRDISSERIAAIIESFFHELPEGHSIIIKDMMDDFNADGARGKMPSGFFSQKRGLVVPLVKPNPVDVLQYWSRMRMLLTKQFRLHRWENPAGINGKWTFLQAKSTPTLN